MGSTGNGSGRITGGPTTGSGTESDESSNFGCAEGLHVPPGPGISGRGSGCVRGGAPVGPMGSTGNGSGRITGGPTTGPMGISGNGSGSTTGGSITGSMVISSELALPKFVRWSDKRAAIVQMRSTVGAIKARQLTNN